MVSVDIAALSLLPENARPYQDRIDLAIDHHPSQEFFARETCLEAESAACGEIVYNIITRLTPVTPDIALPLYVAVSTDTGCFVYSNTTARTHRIAAALMDCGIDAAPVNKALFRTKSRTRLAMEAWMAEWAEYYDHDRVVVMQIPLSLCLDYKATEADVEELSSLAALVEGTDCGVTLRELKDGRVKISPANRPPGQCHGGLCPSGRRRPCGCCRRHAARHPQRGEAGRAPGHRHGGGGGLTKGIIIIDKPTGWTSMDVCPSPQNDGAFCGDPSH